VRSTDGTSFTEAQITAFRETGSSTQQPQAYVSIHIAGVAYANAFLSAAPAAALYKTTDHGATWVLVPTSTLNYDQTSTALAGFHFPWHDNVAESIMYEGYVTVGTGDRVFRINGAARIDISPTISGDIYGVRFWRMVVTSTKDRTKVAASLVNSQAPFTTQQVVSTDSGATWTVIHQDNIYLHVHLADDHRVGYWWGSSGAIGFMNDFATIQDKRGNIPDDFGGIGINKMIAGL